MCNEPPFPEAQNDSCKGLYSGTAAMSILGVVFLVFGLMSIAPIACNVVPLWRVMTVRYCAIVNIFMGFVTTLVAWVLWAVLTSKAECGAIKEMDTCWTLCVLASALALVGLVAECAAMRFYTIEQSVPDYGMKGEMTAQAYGQYPTYASSQFMYPSY
mmetsp:Transcript_45036/g.80554  ORF Transcript_45036/g.80554 Transcript_45036/m.80554 type:complete len:158 (-) Transcript_45036:570-1043(-)